jgi:NADP-dependent 3-hydroxy acid dehydrogenase YdfG
VIEPGAVDTPLLDKRPQPPDAATRAQMLRPDDVAETIAFVLALPKRVAIPELVILPAALQTLGKTS